ncbi:MAG: hypothetical protein HY644_07850 [Acidobacteria bacterium]|nr:hypothetical protein [Acidobacteriota bacterium]
MTPASHSLKVGLALFCGSSRGAVEMGFYIFIAASVCSLVMSADTRPDIHAAQRSPVFRTNVEMVVIRAAVTDPLDRYVVGLEREHFKVFDNKVEQLITHFSDHNAPLSVGIVLDTSDSMSEKLVSAKNSTMRFLKQGTPRMSIVC